MPNVAMDNFILNREEHSQRLRELFEEKQNPLYVWEAIYACLCPPEGYPACAVPEWCQPYLGMVASRLLMLARLKNAKTFPASVADETPEEYKLRWKAWEQKEITTQRASELVPWVMMLERGGWNAFERYLTDLRAKDAAAVYPVLERRDRASAMSWAKKKFNLNEGRSVRRVIQQGMEILKPRTKPRP